MMKTALLVLDIQKDFIGEHARMPVAKQQIEPMLKSINAMIEDAQVAGRPVIYIGNEFEPRQWLSNFFRKHAALKGSEGAALDERLRRVSDLYFSKKQGDAFSNSELVHYLHKNDITHVIICGVFIEGCVTATAKGARKRGFDVTVIRDAVAGVSDQRREQTLKDMELHGIKTI